ncbi:hypothetical protein [Streptomyces sp. NPDC048392]|uniref:hypothetical protein n=1 Tax=Streptomyces sp. NPDC048392 TaxID=3365543 RepID=UPI00371D8E43
MTEPTTPAPPTPEEIKAATRVLMRAWQPGLLLPGDPGYADARALDEEFAEEDGCQCAGTNEDGESLGCNCGDGCTCDNCEHWAYSRAKLCQAGNVSVGTRCTRETEYRVVAYRMQHSSLSAPRTEGQPCPHAGTPEADCHCTERSVFYESGLHPVTYWTRTACSVPCAKQIVEQEQAWRDQHGTQSDLQYYVERWTYEPHDQDLPAPLAALRTATRMAADRTGYLVSALFRGHDHSLNLRLKWVRESVASSAHCAAEDLLTRPDDDVWDDEPPTAVQEEPAEPDALE